MNAYSSELHDVGINPAVQYEILLKWNRFKNTCWISYSIIFAPYYCFINPIPFSHLSLSVSSGNGQPSAPIKRRQNGVALWHEERKKLIKKQLPPMKLQSLRMRLNCCRCPINDGCKIFLHWWWIPPTLLYFLCTFNVADSASGLLYKLFNVNEWWRRLHYHIYRDLYEILWNNANEFSEQFHLKNTINNAVVMKFSTLLGKLNSIIKKLSFNIA